MINRSNQSIAIGYGVLANLMFAITGVLIVGCGGGVEVPELGTVSGVVTLDGQPLVSATVHFEPQSGGRVSMGNTDESGKYELVYSVDNNGATIGTHNVYVYYEEGAFESDSEEPESPSIAGEAPVEIPRKYGLHVTESKDESTEPLSAEVKSGQNDLNFDLLSGQ